MCISANTASLIQTAGGFVALAGGYLSLAGSFGHVCYVRNDAGQYTLDTQGPSWTAAALIAGSYFYTGYSLTGKLVRLVCEVEAIDAPARRILNNH